MKVEIVKNIMGENEKLAEENKRAFKENNCFAINLLASPGAGKTSVLLKLIKIFKEDYDIGVIEGDIASDIDAEKVAGEKVAVTEINTCGGCHLDANMVSIGFKNIVEEWQDVPDKALVFIENIGNLVCPSVFELGENLKLLISSTTEGDDKPYKYLPMFECADIIVLNKIDLLPNLDFSLDYYLEGVRKVNSRAKVILVSCKDNTGFEQLREEIEKYIK